MRVRMVDIHSDRYMIARRYMLRLRNDDFDDAIELEKLAKVLSITPERFVSEFRYLVADEPEPRAFFPEDGGVHPSMKPPKVAPK